MYFDVSCAGILNLQVCRVQAGIRYAAAANINRCAAITYIRDVQDDRLIRARADASRGAGANGQRLATVKCYRINVIGSASALVGYRIHVRLQGEAVVDISIAAYATGCCGTGSLAACLTGAAYFLSIFAIRRRR